MDGRAAIEQNRQALQRIAASLAAMAGLAVGHPEVRAEGEPRRTLPRHLWLAILRLLRPAEAAARRLIIAAARGLAVAPPPRRKAPGPAPKPATMAPLLRSLGIAVMVSPADLARAAARRAAAPACPPRFSLPLCDPPRHRASLLSPELVEGELVEGSRAHRYNAPEPAGPRIRFPGLTAASSPPPPSREAPVSAARLGRRLAALAAALDDLPGQALRFARWKARRDAEDRDPWLPHRASPLRRGRPPGGRLARYDPSAPRPRNMREVDEILAHAHALAVYALECPDTS